MILHTDLPTHDQLEELLETRQPWSVSIYMATEPASRGEAERIELRNLADEAARQLRETGAAGRDVAAIEESIGDVLDDGQVWRYQARSLALFATPATIRTFRLPNRLVDIVEVSDRFHVKPLLRAVTFPHTAFVLALAQGSVRLLEVAPDVDPFELAVDGLPADVASAAGKSSIADRSPSRRLQGSEGQKVRMRQYARQIDQALRPLLSGLELPLILAATEPLDSIYRSVSTYPHLATTTIPGNPETTSDAELIASARAVLDELYAAELARLRELYALRFSQHRASAGVADVARAATYGLVETVLVDIDESMPGSIDEDGAVTFDAVEDAVNYGILDEIARRVWLTGGRVLAVRQPDIPGAGSVAAILRYAP